MKKDFFVIALHNCTFSTVLVVEASATTGTMTDTEMQKCMTLSFPKKRISL